MKQKIVLISSLIFFLFSVNEVIAQPEYFNGSNSDIKLSFLDGESQTSFGDRYTSNGVLIDQSYFTEVHPFCSTMSMDWKASMPCENGRRQYKATLYEFPNGQYSGIDDFPQSPIATSSVVDYDSSNGDITIELDFTDIEVKEGHLYIALIHYRRKFWIGWGSWKEKVTNSRNAINCVCKPVWNISQTFSSGADEKFEAEQTVNGFNKIESGATIKYDGTEMVFLSTGFHAQFGCDFNAFNDGCGGARIAEPPRQDPPQKQSSTTAKSRYENGAQSVNNLLSNIKCYPTPAKDLVNIEYELASEQNVSIEFRDLTGKLIKKIITNETKGTGLHKSVFEVHSYPRGLYFYTLQIGTSIRTGKILIQ